MANFHEHQRKGAITGCLAGAGCYFFFHFKEKEKNPEKKFNVLELLGYTTLGGITGAVAGVLPDKLEPASNPNHRKFCHSGIFCALLGWLTIKIVQKQNVSLFVKVLAVAGLTGYGNHILLDSRTPKSVPLIPKFD